MVEFQNKIVSTDEIANNSARRLIELGALLLSAEEKKEDPSAYIAKLEQAVEIQDRFNYDEPPPWYLPLRQELGQALLDDKRYDEAEKIFKKGLQEYQRNGRFLVGLYQCLKNQNREWESLWVEREAANSLYDKRL